MIQTLVEQFGALHGWIYQTLLQPSVFALHLGAFAEEVFEGTEWFLIGIVELLLLYTSLRPLETLWRGALPQHAIGVGQETVGTGIPGGHNFAALFAARDILFGSADFSRSFEATGVRDQLPLPQGDSHDYGSGFSALQWLGFKRMVEFSRKPAP